MGKYRKLTKEERKILKKRKDLLEYEIKDDDILRQYEEWYLYKGGLQRAMRQLEAEHISKLKELEKRLSNNNFTLAVVNNQLRDGVELKTDIATG